MNLLIASLLTTIGLALLRIIRVPWPRLSAKPRELTSFGGALVLLAALYFFYLSAFYAGLAPAIDWLLLKREPEN